MARIMLVDDSRISRRIMENALTLQGHEVVGEASNGQEALEVYDSVLPDLVTMDITMPTMDGLECLSQLMERHPDAKVIMITAAAGKEKILKAVQAGCLDYIIKPVEEETLISTIEKYV